MSQFSKNICLLVKKIQNFHVLIFVWGENTKFHFCFFVFLFCLPEKKNFKFPIVFLLFYDPCFFCQQQAPSITTSTHHHHPPPPTTTVSPGKDFYQFVNNAWLSDPSIVIPPEYSNLGTFMILRDESNAFSLQPKLRKQN